MDIKNKSSFTKLFQIPTIKQSIWKHLVYIHIHPELQALRQLKELYIRALSAQQNILTLYIELQIFIEQIGIVTEVDSERFCSSRLYSAQRLFAIENTDINILTLISQFLVKFLASYSVTSKRYHKILANMKQYNWLFRPQDHYVEDWRDTNDFDWLDTE